MIESKVDALLTFEKNLQHQENFKKYTKINSYSELTNLTQHIKKYYKIRLVPLGRIIFAPEHHQS